MPVDRLGVLAGCSAVGAWQAGRQLGASAAARCARASVAATMRQQCSAWPLGPLLPGLRSPPCPPAPPDRTFRALPVDFEDHSLRQALVGGPAAGACHPRCQAPASGCRRGQPGVVGPAGAAAAAFRACSAQAGLRNFVDRAGGVAAQAVPPHLHAMVTNRPAAPVPHFCPTPTPLSLLAVLQVLIWTPALQWPRG